MNINNVIAELEAIRNITLDNAANAYGPLSSQYNADAAHMLNILCQLKAARG